MDELIFILILAGIGVVLLVAMFTYYKHQKKINDEIENFNHHTDTIDDVLLNDNEISNASKNGNTLTDNELPDSFTASRQDNFDIDQINITHENTQSKRHNGNVKADSRELVDGVYINSKRVISASHRVSDSLANNKIQTADNRASEAFDSLAHNDKQQSVPSFSASDTVSDSNEHSASAHSQQIKVVYDPIYEGVDELIISHTVLIKGDFLSGQQVYDALKNAGLSFGEMNIFHYPGDEKPETFALFSVANVIEPGTFDLHDETMKTPGISLFMRLPTRIDSHEAYNKFIHVAKMIAADLGGELCDETRSQLTQQAIAYKKEQIKKLNFEMAKAQKLADIGH